MNLAGVKAALFDLKHRLMQTETIPSVVGRVFKARFMIENSSS
jgi:hypothetical protein